jgi:serine/threonine-protein kinase HipA
LKALWRRIVFNIAVSNTDDHLRNHGVLLEEGGWRLSPAFDVNPVNASTGLHLSITDSDNRLDYALAMDVIDFFRIPEREATAIRDEVLSSVSRWRAIAKQIGLSRAEREQMASAFNA